MKRILPIALFTLIGAAGPIPDEASLLYAVPGMFQVRTEGAGSSLEFLDESGAEIARYDLSGCQFKTGMPEVSGGDGAFSLIFPDVAEPMVAAICHPAEGGRRFSIFAPARDLKQPILEITGDSFVHFVRGPGKLVLSSDTNGQSSQEIWHPGVEPDVPDSFAVRELMAGTAGRRFNAPEPVDDAEFVTLAARLAEIATSRNVEALIAMAAPDIKLSFGGHEGVETFREFIADPRFWPEFERVLEGGGVLIPAGERSSFAYFPAMFLTWPDDLDAFEYLYGDRLSGRLRAGPSGKAPVIADLYGRIVARGPYLAADQRLIDDGWVHVCTQADGCGFAREEHVRSPIDWRAIFIQDGEGSPWVLKVYIAGD